MIKDCLESKINELEINKQIDLYAAAHNGESPKYLVMNFDTLSHWKLSSYNNYLIKILGQNEAYFSSFLGIPIAICNKLKFGEIDFI